MAAQVKTSDVNQTQIVELITAGRSGSLGLVESTNGAAA
jgi:D-xylose transport system ATP-binding protein